MDTPTLPVALLASRDLGGLMRCSDELARSARLRLVLSYELLAGRSFPFGAVTL